MGGLSAYLTARLEVGEEIGLAALFDVALEQKLLTPVQRDKLKALSALVSRVQTSLVSGGRTRVSQKDLSQAHLLMLDITKAIDHRQRP